MSIFVSSALSIPGGHFLLNGLLVCFSEFLIISRLVCSHIYPSTQLIINYLGELEETISRSFVNSANLRTMLSKDCPEALKHCEPMFSALVNPQVRNTLITDILSFSFGVLSTKSPDEDISIPKSGNAQRIPEELHHVLSNHLQATVPHTLNHLSHVTKDGITYLCSSKHLGNSCILIKSEQYHDGIPAQLDRIVQVQRGKFYQTLLIIHPHIITKIHDDPFSRYPTLCACLISPNFDQLQVVALSDVQCHFAYCPIIWRDIPTLVMLSLSRVSN